MNNPKAPSVSKTLHNKSFNLVASIIVGFIFLITYRDVFVSLFAFGTGMFLDADHLFDYILYIFIHRKPFSFKQFIEGSYFPEWKKFITPLHSWELVALSFIVFLISNNPFAIAIAASLSTHYIVDYLTNDVNKLAYFLIFRAKNHFLKASIRK